MKRTERGLLLVIRDRTGFSLVEVISVLVILGVLAAAVISRYSSTATIDATAQASAIKNSVRFAQSRAMKLGDPTDPNTIWGIKAQGGQYWLFKTVSPDDAANLVTLPSESNQKVTVANNRVTITDFLVFFDSVGRPYTAYTSSTVNTPVGAGNPVTVTVNSTAGGAAVSFTVTPETGFVQ